MNKKIDKMAQSNEEWELSKENIQPIQQGRKQKVLKVALAPHPEDLVLQERQAFEYELRTYSGNDPLSVWCKYIKWVEQNFPKGGREGHIKQLIERCLAILKDEKKYYDDERFIDILLKFANINGKPLDVYNYMYSHNIGCKSVKYFISWSWELEQLGNLKKADLVLTEGIQRQAEPIEKMQAYRKEFETRLAYKIKEGTENSNFECDSRRSAFAMLKPQKKNLAPVLRIGEAVVDKGNPLLFNRLQPQPKKSSVPSKVPFKVFNSENVTPSLPVQSQLIAGSILHSENYKENEQKPSKWNKVKVKPRVQNSRTPSEVNPCFKFHCDDENEQEACTPRSVPKTSNILSVRCRTPSPVIALFEPPDPLKRAMYPKNKVYGGAEEYSLEEIRAAQWFERKKRRDEELMWQEQKRQTEEQARKKEELEKEVDKLTKQVQLLQNILVIPPSQPVKLPFTSEMIYSDNNTGNIENPSMNNIHSNDLENKPQTYPQNNASYGRQNPQISLNNDAKDTTENQFPLPKHLYKSNNSVTDTFDTKTIDSTSYRTAAKMVQDLYNNTLTHTVDNSDAKTNDFNIDLDKCGTSASSKYVPDLAVANHKDEKKSDLKELRNDFPFEVFHDPTEVVSDSNKIKSSLHSLSPSNVNLPDISHVPKQKSHKKEFKNDLSFMFSHTEDLPPPTTAALHTDVPGGYAREYSALNRPSTVENEDSFEEDAENIPPQEYVQEKSKRELAGILEPAKNILFVPLEEQEELEDDSDTEDALINQPRIQHADETLVPPSNTEQFSTAMFFASTPRASRHKERLPSLTVSKNNNAPLDVNNVSQNNCLEKENNQISASKELVTVKNVVTKTEVVLTKEPSANPLLPKVLSVIMETSSENYSKSSSSSSSSANLTKSSHLDPSHFSSVRKHYSKLETYERCSLTSVSEVPDSATHLHSFKNGKTLLKGQEKVENMQEIKLHTADFDPFDIEETYKHLTSVDFSKYTNLFNAKKSLKFIKIGENISIGSTSYRIEALIAEGAYAKVYQAIKLFSLNCDLSLDEKIAIKVCKSSNEWEFYICCEMQKRLAGLSCLPDIKCSVMNVTSAVKYTDGIVVANEYSNRGTLLDIINFYKMNNSSIPESIAMYLTLEILHIVSRLHEVNIIHGDIKPDNFLITKNAFGLDVLKSMLLSTTSLCLIDFGRSIDLNCYKKGVCFTAVFKTSEFKCTEMKENKPWVFQLDWYGVLSCIHTMLFSEYMVVKKKNDRWQIEKKFKRYWFTSLWELLFSELLNIPECYQQPDIKKFTDMIETKLQQNSQSFMLELRRLTTLYSENKKFSK